MIPYNYIYYKRYKTFVLHVKDIINELTFNIGTILLFSLYLYTFIMYFKVEIFKDITAFYII